MVSKCISHIYAKILMDLQHSVHLRMTLPTVTIFAVIAGLVLGEQLKCGVNEEIDACPSQCPYEHCPKEDERYSEPCKKPEKCPAPACKCMFNHRRASNGTCIHTISCPPFNCDGQNEVFDSCPSYCPAQDCDSATPHGECPFYFLFIVECSPTCRCIEHHWRKDGVCVSYEDCLN